MSTIAEVLGKTKASEVKALVAEVDLTGPAKTTQVRVAKPKPKGEDIPFIVTKRAVDPLDAAITQQRRTEQNRRTQEEPVTQIDLHNMADAELGAHVKATMMSRKAEQIVATKPETEKAKRKTEKANLKGVAKEQKRRRNHVLKAFMVGTLEVPTLDLSDVSSLDECPSAVERSPYNKARFRLEKAEPLDPEDTTYGVLASEHGRLTVLAGGKVTGEPKSKKAGKKAKAITVDLNPGVEAKVIALVKLTGLSEKEARRIVVG